MVAERSRVRRWLIRLAVGMVVLVMMWIAGMTYRIVMYKHYVWLPAYLNQPLEEVPDSQKHVVFVWVDHFEPGGPDDKQRAIEQTESWLSHYRPLALKYRDDYGNPFRYTWFYPYDHQHQEVLELLSKQAFDDLGEVELHWHHPKADNRSFPSMLEEAVRWFHQEGAMISSEDGTTQFGFIHGAWALDNSTIPDRCGVTRELDILKAAGCFADFTFPTVGSDAQPSVVNSIYYATDTDDPKSHDTGDPVEVGNVVSDKLMIFQGPIAFSWLTGATDYAALEYDPDLWPSRKRVKNWIGANVHVRGRPEWVFVKVFSHGAQSSIIVEEQMENTLRWLKEECANRQIKLHFMSAREAYNVVKAAENGKTGNPEDYRDYLLKKPRNMVVDYSVDRSDEPPDTSD